MLVGFVDLDLSWRSLYFTKYEQLNRHLKRQLKAQHIALQSSREKKCKHFIGPLYKITVICSLVRQDEALKWFQIYLYTRVLAWNAFNGN